MRPCIWLFGMLLMLVLPAVHAVDLGGSSTMMQSQLWVTHADNQVNATTLVFEPGQPPAAVAQRIATNQQILAFCQQNSPQDIQGCLISKSAEASKTATYPVKFRSVPDANVTYEYWNPFRAGGAGWVPVPGCALVAAKPSGTIPDPSGNPVQLYTSTCPVDKNIYKGRTINVRITYVPGPNDNITASTETVVLSDATSSPLAAFASALTNALNQQAQAALGGGTLSCIGVFLILGLLLASMYFAGKSPITLLDVTTPKLPSPKGFTASGQIIAPFGYSEMKVAVKKQMGAAAVAAGAFYDSEKGKLSQSMHDAVNKMAGNIKDAEQAKMFKAIAAAHLAKGGKISDLKAIAKPFSAMSENDHATFRQILNKLERAGGKYQLLATTGGTWHQGASLMETLGVVTHKGGKVTTAVQKVLGKAYGLDRYKGLGFIPATFDSAARSTKMIMKGTEATVVHGAQFLRETGKLAVETMGGKGALRAMEEKAKTSATYSALYGQLTKKAKEISIGSVMPIDRKMGHSYRILYEAMQKDQMAFLLKQSFSKMGVKVAAMTDRDLFAMASGIVDPVAKCGYRSSSHLTAVEAEIFAILSNKNLSMMEKRDKLEAMLKQLGGKLDASYVKVREDLDKIGREKAEDHVKLIMLQEMLDRENMALKAARSGEERLDEKYHPLVGRNGRLSGSDMWEVALLQKMITDIGDGTAAKGVSLRDFMNSVRLDVENTLMTLNPNRPDLLPEFMRDKAMLQKKADENRRLLAGQLTDEGERVLKELTGKNRNNATLNDFMKVLYGNPYMNKSQGIKDIGEGVHIDKKTGARLWWEDAQAIGPQAGWWMTNMKGLWLNGITTPELGLTVGAGTEAKFTRPFTSAHAANPALAAELDRYPGARTWSPQKRDAEFKKLWVKDDLEKHLHNMFNDRFANAYAGSTNETHRFYYSAAASLLGKALRDSGYDENHADLRFLGTLDMNNPKDMERFRNMIGKRYKTEFEEVLKKGVTFDDIVKSKTAWMMTHEGSYVPYSPNMPASENDRLINGHVALFDGKNWRRYSPDDTRVEFKGRDDLAVAFNRVAGSGNRGDWEPVLKQVMEWAKDGDYEKKKVLGAVLWRYGNVTYDYMSYWKESGVRVVPRSEAMPLAPSLLRFFGVDSPELSKTLKPFRDFGQTMGHFLLRTTMDGMGEWHLRQYDVAPRSQMLKMYQWRASEKILSTDLNKLFWDASSDEERSKLAAAFRAYALAQGDFHGVWAFAIDRSYNRASTSHGAQSAYAAAFPSGPCQPFHLKSNLRGYMSGPEYTSFMALYGWPAAMARKAIMPYQKMIAGPQRSLTGYISKWDYSSVDALRPFGTSTSPRLLEAFRGYNPMSFSWGRGWASEKLQWLNHFQSRAEQAQIVGYDHQTGLKQGYSEKAWSTRGRPT